MTNHKSHKSLPTQKPHHRLYITVCMYVCFYNFNFYIRSHLYQYTLKYHANSQNGMKDTYNISVVIEQSKNIRIFRSSSCVEIGACNSLVTLNARCDNHGWSC